MDKKFDNVIIKMEDLITRSSELQVNIQKSFSKVSKTQNEIDNKIININEELAKTFKKMSTESENLFSKIKEDIAVKNTEFSEVKKKFEHLLNDLHDTYNKKVDALVSSINERSDKVLTIFNELEKIKQIQQEAKDSFKAMSEEQQNIINTLKEQNTGIEKDTIMKLKKQVDANELKIKELEKYKHKHKFGGIKV
jgi:hypothetical protein